MLRTSQNGLDLIKFFEGFRDTAYQDTAVPPVFTIGYGTTFISPNVPVTEGMRCSEQQASLYLTRDIENAEHAVLCAVTVPLNQNQFDALVSWTYNLGGNSLRSSTLLRKLNDGDLDGAAEQFPLWCHAGGKVSQGLLHRREMERDLFLAS